ncbi:MAG: iron-sulfur cluster assembly protein [Ilumatobacteraceae bacterium]
MTAAISAEAPPEVLAAVTSVSDPEYPGLSIVDLGLMERVEATERDDGSHVTVGLIPTFSGCPALAMIAADVRAAVEAVPGVAVCRVEWLTAPVWSVERVTPAARTRLGAEFSVVLRGADGGLRCPVCGSADVEDRSLAGPTRCRSVAWCDDCRNVVEVMR